MYAPFDNESCRSLLQHHEELQKAFAATFMRQLHLTAQALSLRTGARDAPIANAQYAAKTDGGAVSFEVRLPLSALPRTASNEIASLSVAAERAGSAPPSEPNPNALASVTFGTPIRFGLDSEVLTCLLQNVNGLMPLTPRFSYQPGTPNQVLRVANQGGYAIETTEVTLSTREGGLGPVEVRAVYGASTFAAILKDGHLVECASVGDILGVVERGKGLHIIGYNEGIEESVGAPYGYYSVVEIDKDGTPQYEELLEVSQESFQYSSVGGDHAKNLATFSISGTYRTNEGGTQQHELLWRYDKRTNHYALKQRKGRYVPPTSSEPSYSDPQY